MPTSIVLEKIHISFTHMLKLSPAGIIKQICFSAAPAVVAACKDSQCSTQNHESKHLYVLPRSCLILVANQVPWNSSS